ncbi:hypothetical protein TYRP_003162 [Tyrophagus putrescentiae]|nr:hypothetical protein TYRP_003162 [Tyrophagus putrescentiae]
MFSSASQRQKTSSSSTNHEGKTPIASSSSASRHIEYLVCAMNCAGVLKYYGKWSTSDSSCWIKQWQVTKEADKAKVEQLKVATKAFADWKKAGKAKGFGQRIGGRLWLSNSSEGKNFLSGNILSADHPAVLQFHRIIFNRTLVPPYYDHLLLFIFYLEAYVDALLSILTDCLAMFTVDFWASKDAPLGDLVLTYEKMLMLVNVDKGGGSRGGKKRGLSENGAAAAVDKSGTKTKKVKVVTKSAAAGADKKPTNAQSSQAKKKGKENVEGDASGNTAAAATPQSSQGSTSGGGSGSGHRSALFTQCIKKGTMRTSVKPVRKVFTPEGSQSYPSQRYYSYLTSK